MKNKVTDQEILDSYQELKSVWKVGEKLGLVGQTVHVRLKKLGVDTSMNVFSKKDLETLKKEYFVYKESGNLQVLAEKMGRTKQFICRKAKELGLTNQKSQKKYLSVWAHMEEPVARSIFENFKKSRGGLNVYCKRKKFCPLGFSSTMKKYFLPEYEALIELKHTGNKYKKGRNFEYKVKNYLQELGFFVIRSAGSKTPADLIAFKKNCLLFIQCKDSDSWYCVQEWNTFYSLCISVGATPIAVIKGMNLKMLTGLKDGSKNKCPWVDYQVPNSS